MIEEKLTNYLGIDWGERKIGLALAHAETRVAVAYGMIQNDETVWERLRSILQQEAIGTVVLGLPDRPESQSAERVKVFGEQLAKDGAVEVVFTNEMFTSILAQQNLIAQGVKEVAANDDAEAAKILLQDWLDKQ